MPYCPSHSSRMELGRTAARDGTRAFGLAWQASLGRSRPKPLLLNSALHATGTTRAARGPIATLYLGK